MDKFNKHFDDTAKLVKLVFIFVLVSMVAVLGFAGWVVVTLLSYLGIV